MTDMSRFSERVVDVAERFADIVDAAEGKGGRKSRTDARWLILPAAGAAAYALATSGSRLARETRELMRRAKDHAADLPETDLFDRVKEVTGFEQESSSSSGARTQKSTGGSQGRTRTAATKRKSQRKRATTSAR
jgi:hypothetical protein